MKACPAKPGTKNSVSNYRPYPEYKDSGVDWLGEVPTHWEVLKLRRTLQRQRRKNNDGKVREMLSLSAYRGVVAKEYDDEALVRPHEENQNYQVVEPGQLVVNPMWVINSSIGVSGVSGIVSPAYRVYDIVAGLDDYYFHNLLKSSLYLTQYNRYIRGLTTYDRSVREGDFLDIEALIPPLPEQQAIGRFLDHKTSEIDELIAAKERLIELLQEKRAALIIQAVTKGLDPDVPMKDSGVAWLGRVPAHWEVKRLKHTTKEHCAGPFGSSLTKDMYGGSTFRVYGQEQVIPGDFTVGDYYIPEEKYQEMIRFSVQPGDVLLSCVGTFGGAAIVPLDAEPGIINPRLIKIRPASSQILPEYLELLLKSSLAYTQMEEVSQGGTMDIINLGLVLRLLLPSPPISEQLAMRRFVDRRTSEIDELVLRVKYGIEHLQE